MSSGPYLGRSTDNAYPPVVATSNWPAQDPAATSTVLTKYWSRCSRFQAVASVDQSIPFGHKAIGWRNVSWVGVIAPLANHRIGPSPMINRMISRATVENRSGYLTCRRRRSNSEMMPRSSAVPFMRCSRTG